MTVTGPGRHGDRNHPIIGQPDPGGPGAAGGRQNMSGILEAAPELSAASSAGAVPSSLEQLRARVTDGLSRHEDARRCYERARAVRR